MTVARWPSAANLAVMWLLLAVHVLAMAWALPDRTLTSDGATYLLSSDLIAHGRHFADDLVSSATWPLLYPTLIAGVSLATGLEAYWASKLLNLILVAAAFASLRAMFGERAHVYGAVLFIGSSLAILPATLSEVPFIIFLILFCLALHRCRQAPGLGTAALVVLAGLAVFTSRYIGLFVVGAIGLFALWELRQRHMRSFLLLSGSAAGIFAGAVGYLMWNVARTGRPTGMARSLNATPFPELLADLAQAQVMELNVLRLGFSSGDPLQMAAWALAAVAVAGFAVMVWRRWREEGVGAGSQSAWQTFFLVGGVYWMAVVGMRFVFNFDTFSYRLLAPSTVLFLLGAVDLLLAGRRSGALVARGAVALVALSVPLTILPKPLLAWKNDTPTYAEQKSRHARLAPSSILLFGEPLATYLRPDLKVVVKGAYYARDDISLARDELCPRYPGGIYRERSEYVGAVPGRPAGEIERLADCPAPEQDQ